MNRLSFAAITLLALLMPFAALAEAIGPGPHQIILGDIASQIITWAIAAFGPLIAAAILALLLRMLKAAGLKNTDLLKDQLQRIVVNGVNAGAERAARDLRGKGAIDIKTQATVYAVGYAQAHGAEIIKALGLDPKSGEATEAIRARIETALADPVAPTSPLVSSASVATLPVINITNSNPGPSASAQTTARKVQ